jgi:hypothetical protein
VDVVIWNKQSGDEVKRLTRHKDCPMGIVINPGNPSEFVSFGYDNSFIVHVSEHHSDL